MTGVERGDRDRAWFVNLPSTWERARIKSIAKRVTDGAHISPETDSGVFDFVSTRDISRGIIDFDGSLKTSPESYAYMVQTGCKPKRGDVLFSKDGSVGVTALVAKDHNFVVASSLIIVSPDARRMDSRYLNFAFSAQPLIEQAKAFTRGAGLPRISIANLARIEIPLPPLDEQRAIADYLDQETAQIDALVAKQEELIGLLRERRVAEVSSATTRGLRLNSKNFPSGWREGMDARDYNSNWYQDLPSGWVRGRVKSISRRVTDGAHISPETEDGRFDFVSTRDLKHGEIDFAGALKTSPETYSYMVRTGCQPRRGDVLFSKDGTVGTTAVVATDHKFVVASSLIIISPIQSVMSSSFLNYTLASRPVTEQTRMFTRGAGLPRISIANLASIEISIPPIGEQVQIVRHLDEQTSRIDTLIAKAEEHIALAKERRAALITAAVTGQIDVRTATQKVS